MKAAYKDSDGMKIDGRRIVVDCERGRTVKGWIPRRLGGGLGGSRIGAPHQNIRTSGRVDSLRGGGGGFGGEDYRGGGGRRSYSERGGAGDEGRGGGDRYRDSGRRDSRGGGGGDYTSSRRRSRSPPGRRSDRDRRR